MNRAPASSPARNRGRGRTSWRSSLYTALCLGPVLLVVSNSFKSRASIFGAPLTLPGPTTFDLAGYRTVWARACSSTIS